MSSAILKKLVIAAVVMALAAAGVFAQEWDTAYIPVVTNVDATVSIQPLFNTEGVGERRDVAANTVEMFTILLDPAYTSVTHRGARRNAPAHGVSVKHGRGGVSLTLSPEAYGKAEIAVYTLGGKRVLRGKAAAGVEALHATPLQLSKASVAAGVYLLSVRGTKGNAFRTRLTHGGGRLDVSAAFGDGGFAPLNKSAALPPPPGYWDITASGQGYLAPDVIFEPVKGTNNLRTITLLADSGMQCAESESGFMKGNDLIYGGKTYPTIIVKYYMGMPKRWMAKNLDNAMDRDKSWAYDPEKYGGLYTWHAAKCACAVIGDGWRLPNIYDWYDLIGATGAIPDYPFGEGSYNNWTNGAAKLKTDWGWYWFLDDANNGTDDIGFSALPGGAYIYNYGFRGARQRGYWWGVGATESDASLVEIENYDVRVYPVDGTDKFDGASVRCVRDE